MTATAWKDYERWVAKRWGGERVPVTGRVRGYAPDVAHATLAIEAKTRQKLPAYLWEALDQADKAGEWAEKRDGVYRLPVVVIHQDHTPYVNSWVLQRLESWETIAEKAIYVEVNEGAALGARIIGERRAALDLIEAAGD